MTDTPNKTEGPTTVDEALDEAAEILGDQKTSEGDLPGEPWPLIELERCEISFMINVTDVRDLSEALEVAAGSLGRYGMDAFYVMAADPDTGRKWIIREGQVTPLEEALDGLEREREKI